MPTGSPLLEGGNIDAVVQALSEPGKGNIDLDFGRAAAMDLRIHRHLDGFQSVTTGQVLQTPLVSGMAEDGIQVSAICRVTVKGGAGEDTGNNGSQERTGLTSVLQLRNSGP